MKNGYRIFLSVALLLLVGSLLLLPVSAGEASERLDDNTAWLGERLGTQIARIASGELGSSVIEISGAEFAAQGMKTEWTKEELGVASIEDFAAVRNLFLAQMSGYDNLLNALLHDYPYEMYWFDKTIGVQYNCLMSQEGIDQNNDHIADRVDRVTVTALQFTFAVSTHYCDGDLTTLDTAKTAAASAVLNTANQIVARYASLPDYERLIAYRDEICALVSYNTAAASPSYVGGYGDPWQLIYVFDGDPTTNVVCEGYAKAFQLLCDLSAFQGDVTCYTVTGDMIGATGAGPHMWNIVTMENGKSYLVDVTNSDANTVGDAGGLFLDGYDGEITNGFDLEAGGSTVTYVYDADTKNLWGTDAASILRIDESDYEPPAIVITVARPRFVYNGLHLTAGESAADIIYRASSTLTHTLTWRVEWYNGSEKMLVAPINAGTYTVKVYADSQTTPGVTFEAEQTVTIEKATPTYIAPSVLAATYGDPISSVSLPAGFTWQTDGRVGGVGVQTHYATFTPIDPDNYETLQNIPVYVTVVRAIPDYTAPERFTVEYGDRASELALPQGFSLSEGADVRFLSLGETSVTLCFTPTDTVNYQTVEGITVPVTVLRRDISDATVTLTKDALTYTGGELFPTVESVLLDGMTVTYTIEGESAIRTGEYTLTLTGTGNFTGSCTVEWSIVPQSTQSSAQPSTQSPPSSSDGASAGTPSAALPGNANEIPWTIILIVGGGVLFAVVIVIIIVSASKRR